MLLSAIVSLADHGPAPKLYGAVERHVGVEFGEITTRSFSGKGQTETNPTPVAHAR